MTAFKGSWNFRAVILLIKQCLEGKISSHYCTIAWRRDGRKLDGLSFCLWNRALHFRQYCWHRCMVLEEFADPKGAVDLKEPNTFWTKQKISIHCKVVSSSTSRLEAHPCCFRLLMKGKSCTVNIWEKVDFLIINTYSRLYHSMTMGNLNKNYPLRVPSTFNAVGVLDFFFTFIQIAHGIAVLR